MANTHKVVIILLILFGISITLSPGNSSALTPGFPTPTPMIESIELSDTQLEIEQAIHTALYGSARMAPANLIFKTQIQRVQISSDENLASALLVPVDPQTDLVVATEPGLAIITKQSDGWEAILPGSPSWMTLVKQAPAEILNDPEKTIWLEINTRYISQAAFGPYGGYKLPWAGGETMAMTQSVAHDRYTPSGNAHYAFDFATPGTAKMFNLHAAKAGRVKYSKDSCTNGSESCSNWLVLEDTTTSPTTYQLYLHLAQNSIPSQFKTIGTFVQQGQFIGVADDTGVSTAHHLHFMVHTNPASYWGTSVDITFSDVSINGGRPRILADRPYCKNNATYQDVCDEFSYYYVSGNYPGNDNQPPYGDILEPLDGLNIETGGILLEGWANDDQSGLGSARFIANWDGNWQDIGDPYSSLLFSYNWDLCAANVPDGPVELALKIFDKAGNQAPGLPGLRHLMKNFPCPSPPQGCLPGNNQVTLFAEPDLTGACQIFEIGDYSGPTALNGVGENQAESIQVGNNVIATLFFNRNYSGRGETFSSTDRNLSDNVIGANHVSSLFVRSVNTNPGVPLLVWPTENLIFPYKSSLSLVWDNSGNSLEFQVRLLRNGTIIITSPWITTPYWNLGSLTSGPYTWQVRARNNSATSSWSGQRSFSIEQVSSTTPTSINAPFSDNMEGNTSYWIRSAYWDRTMADNHTPAGGISWFYDVNRKPQDGYDTGSPNSGDLTSIPIILPANPFYYLRFWYLYETENPGRLWDQRWVQISVDGSPFTNTVQLLNDPPNVWLQSPVISLAEYAGNTVQIRFHFETMDGVNNKYRGWFIDDVSITSDPPAQCNPDGEPNNTHEEALFIQYSGSHSGVICPGGDLDYFKFSGSSGDRIGAVVFGSSTYPNSLLDPNLTLFDRNGASILAENDDQILAQRTDSELYYSLTESGDYYLMVRSWDNPSSGSDQHFYTLNLYNDNTPPVASFSYPTSWSVVPNQVISLRVTTYDQHSDISHVVFFWHSGDWQNGVWTKIGEDWDVSDGWRIPFDVSQFSSQDKIAFSATVYDRAGNTRNIGVWHIQTSGGSKIYTPLITK